MKKIIHTKKAPNCIGPYVQAINIKNMIFISGQIGLCPNTGQIISNDIKQQTNQALNNIKEIIQTEKINIENIIKTTLFITNINDLDQINIVYQNFFIIHHAKFPARSCVEVNNLPKNAKIEIEAIAILS